MDKCGDNVNNIEEMYNNYDELFSQNINDKNIGIIIDLLQNIYGNNQEVKYKKNENGEYVVSVGEQELFTVNESYKIGDVITAISNIDSNQDGSRNVTEPQREYNGPKQRSNQTFSKIDINLSNAYQIAQLYKNALTSLGNYQYHINRSYITEKLSAYYNVIGDNTAELIYTLAYFATGLSETINMCVSMYMTKDEKDYAELESLCNDLWGTLAENAAIYKSVAESYGNDPAVYDPLSNLTARDYEDILREGDAFFEGLYVESVEEFQARIEIAYQNVLRQAVPQVYNMLFEFCYTSYNDGSQTLEEYKNQFAQSIISEYYIDGLNGIESPENIPDDLWNQEGNTDYDRALLLITYDDKFLDLSDNSYNLVTFSGNAFTRALETTFHPEKIVDTELYEDNPINNICCGAFEYLANVKRLYTTDYTNMTVKEVVDYITRETDNLKYHSYADLNESSFFLSTLYRQASITSGRTYSDSNNTYYSCLHWADSLPDEVVLKWMNRDFDPNNPNRYTEEDESDRYTSVAEIKEQCRLTYDSLLENNPSYIAELSALGINNADDFYRYEVYSQTFDKDIFHEEYAHENGVYNYYNLLRTYYSNSFQDQTVVNYIYGNTSKSSDELVSDQLDRVFATHTDRNGMRMINQFQLVDFFNDDNLYVPFANALGELCNKKLRIDAVKNNFEMSAAEQLNVDDVTEEDMEIVKNLYYDDLTNIGGIDYYCITDYETGDGVIKHGTRWDILSEQEQKALAKIYKINPDYATRLVNGGYNNLIADSEGHASAINTAQGILDGKIIGVDLGDFGRGAESFGVGFGDGLFDSIRGVKRFVYADGKMDTRDYYASYLQSELQNSEYEWTAITYNLGSSTGNMTIPMILSAFVPVYGQLASLLWTGMSTAGNETEHLMWEGVDRATAFQIGALKGLIAIGSDKLLGGLTGISDTADKPLKMFSKLFNGGEKVGMGTKLLRFAATMFSNQVNEMKDELVENALGYAVDAVYGRDLPTLDEFVQESWQTAYMTFLSTPLINFMGGAFQKAGVNVPQKVKLNDGLYATYSAAEINRFVDANGNLDQKAFFIFLSENNRFSDNFLGNMTLLNIQTLENNTRTQKIEAIRNQMSTDIRQMLEEAMLSAELTSADAWESVPQRGTINGIKYDPKTKSYTFTYLDGTTATVSSGDLTIEQKQAIFDNKYRSSYNRAQSVMGDNIYGHAMADLQQQTIELIRSFPYYTPGMEIHILSYVETQFACEIDNVVYSNTKSNYTGTSGKFKGVSKYHVDADGKIVVDEIMVEQGDKTVTIPYTHVIANATMIRDKAMSTVSDNLVRVLAQNEQMYTEYGMNPEFLIMTMDRGVDTSDVVEQMPDALMNTWHETLNIHYDLETGSVDSGGDNVVVFQTNWSLNKYAEKDKADKPLRIGYPTGQWVLSIDALVTKLDASHRDLSSMSDIQFSDFICEIIGVPAGSYGTDLVMVTGNVEITQNNVSNNIVDGANSQFTPGGATSSGGFEAVTDGKMDISNIYGRGGISEIRDVLTRLVEKKRESK